MYRYLHPGDYTMQIRKEIKDLIGGADEGKLLIAETAAVSEMKSYLKKLYDIDNIFFLMRKYDKTLSASTGTIVFYNENDLADEQTKVYEALVDIVADDADNPGATGTENKWRLFAKRNPFINMYLVDITLYHLHSKDATRLIPKIREERYADAQAWLKLVAAGKIDADLPQLPDTDTNYKSDIRYNSHPVENQRW